MVSTLRHRRDWNGAAHRYVGRFSFYSERLTGRSFEHQSDHSTKNCDRLTWTIKGKVQARAIDRNTPNLNPTARFRAGIFLTKTFRCVPVDALLSTLAQGQPHEIRRRSQKERFVAMCDYSLQGGHTFSSPSPESPRPSPEPRRVRQHHSRSARIAERCLGMSPTDDAGYSFDNIGDCWRYSSKCGRHGKRAQRRDFR